MTYNKRIQHREINEPIFHITISQIRVKSNSTQENLVNKQGPLQPFHAHPKYNYWDVFGVLGSVEQSQIVWVGLLWSLVVSGGLLRSEVVTESLCFW
jgi:hypothetical protein